MLDAAQAPSGDAQGQAILAGLFATIHKQKAPDAARRLVSAFGSFPAALAASPLAQSRVLDGEPRLLQCLASLKAAMLHGLAAEVATEPVIATSDSLLRYLDVAMAYEPREHVRVLFLNAANRLLADELVTSGSVNSAELYPREIMRRALELGSTALILVHNHPSGNPEPSRADIRGTRDVIEAGRTLGIAVHDHIIIARGGYTSLRQRGLL